MTEVQQQTDTFLSAYSRFADSTPGGQEWLQPIRNAAIEQFADMGLPTLKDEEWRFTSLKPLHRLDFELPVEPGPIRADDFASWLIPGLDAVRCVFIDGFFAPSLSSVDQAPPTVVIKSLAEALSDGDVQLRSLFEQDPGRQYDAFAALNTAFVSDGLYINVQSGAQVELPIYVIHVTTGGTAPVMTHPRHVVVAGEGSRVTVLEQYIALQDSVYLTNVVTDVLVAKNARVDHYLLEQDSQRAFSVSTLRIEQEDHSEFNSHTVLLGGAIVRNNIHPRMNGQHCECLVNGLFVGSRDQHLDNHMRVEHAKPNCDSRQFYKGILDDRASGVFTGRIIVHEDAQKTDAKQTNANLLLSDDALIHAHPQLEIYADDVKCTHGATIGELDEESLFYLQSRGLDRYAARNMLIYGFASESLERMELQAVQDYLRQVLFERLPHGELLARAF